MIQGLYAYGLVADTANSLKPIWDYAEYKEVLAAEKTISDMMARTALRDAGYTVATDVTTGELITAQVVTDTVATGGTTAIGQSSLALVETEVIEDELGYRLISSTPIKAAVTSLPAVQLAGAVAVGAGVGVLAYNTNKPFWNDLSNALFDGFGGQEVMPVLIRLTEEGYFSYARTADVETVVENLYNLSALKSEVETDTPTVGVKDFTAGPVDMGYINDMVRRTSISAGTSVTPPNSSAVASAFNHAISNFPNANVIAVQTGTFVDSDTLVKIYISIRLFNYTSPTVNVGQSGSYGLSANLTANGHLFSYNIGRDGNIERISEQILTSGTVSIGIFATSGNGFYTSNLFSTVRKPNPAIIEKVNTTVAPSPALFWDTFPDWKDNEIETKAYNPQTGENKRHKWIPLGALNFNPDASTDEDTATDQDSVQKGKFKEKGDSPSPEDTPSIFKGLANLFPFLPIPTLPENPIGNTPTPLLPTTGFGSSQALFTVYNPTQSEVNALGGYLWTENIIEIIEKFFKNNPLDAIISLHMIYGTPTTGSPKNIKLGYLDSGVPAKVVTQQYETIDCGSVVIPEYFHDARDYDATTVEIYLPFIGMRSLSAKDIVGSILNVKFIIDVYTGTILCQLKVTKENVSQILYQYEGNCSVQIPLTSADRSRIISGVLGAVGGAAATGNPIGAAVGAIGGFGSSETVQRSGSFSGNAGAMAIKKPYLIITRKKDAQPNNYQKVIGYPASAYARIGDTNGFVRMPECHVDSIYNATDAEKNAIAALLAEGIIV